MPTTRNPIDLYEFLNSTYPKSTKKHFSKEEKAVLRPIAETLAMMDGNAFFGMSLNDDGDDVWYEQYLQEAWRIWKANGGIKGWAGEASFAKAVRHENEAVEEAYQNWWLLKILSKKSR